MGSERVGLNALLVLLAACGDGEFCEARIDGRGSDVGLGQISVRTHGDACHVEVRGDTVLMIRDTLAIVDESGHYVVER